MSYSLSAWVWECRQISTTEKWELLIGSRWLQIESCSFVCETCLVTTIHKEITQMSRSTSLKGYYNDKRSSISSNAIMRKQVTYSNCHRRTVRITTAEMDKEQSYPRCSYISTSDEGGMYRVNVWPYSSCTLMVWYTCYTLVYYLSCPSWLLSKLCLIQVDYYLSKFILLAAGGLDFLVHFLALGFLIHPGGV